MIHPPDDDNGECDDLSEEGHTTTRGGGDGVSPMAGRRRPDNKDERHGDVVGRRADKFVTMTLQVISPILFQSPLSVIRVTEMLQRKPRSSYSV